MELSPVSGDTSQRLAAAGLDPARIADIIGATVAEDLDGGVDI
ncbi:MAG: nicotinate-nucleotide diphosphorylase (carboxylating), partial [Actinobacteria bacterium]|nr:nicotinate-nucleotide diphosphorylase (carboxylating) [Actinomycetota bacterium]